MLLPVTLRRKDTIEHIGNQLENELLVLHDEYRRFTHDPALEQTWARAMELVQQLIVPAFE